VPLVGINAAEGKTVRRGAPPALRLRFPVGARIELERWGEWSRGTVVSHWYRDWQFGAGEYAVGLYKLNSADPALAGARFQPLSL
jgi:hypothetical protein